MRAAALLAGIGLGACFLYALFVEPQRLLLRELTLPCAGLRSQPVRILLFSDVDFIEPGRRERTIRRAADGFRPDLILVAGDFLDRTWTTQDANVLGAAARFFRSLPAPGGRYLAVGEEESPAWETLRSAWSDGAMEVLSNESRRLSVRGEQIDLFVAHPRLDGQPWGVAGNGSRPFVYSRGRRQAHVLLYQGPGALDWREVEITFAFEALERNSYIDLRAAWQPGEGPPVVEGRGWRIMRHEFRRDLKVFDYSSRKDHLAGRLESGFTPPPGRWCRGRVRLTDEAGRSRLRARFWLESEPEPTEWMIDASDDAPDRPRGGTIALGGRRGGRRYADLRVIDLSGRVLLQESFADRSRLRSLWRYRSALADWVFDSGSPQGARLILVHNPDLVLDLADIGGPPLSLVLAGHTHGGQIRLPGFGALFTGTAIGRRYGSGVFEFGRTPLLITSGVGTSFLPLRFLAPPEVVLLTLVPSPAAAAP